MANWYGIKGISFIWRGMWSDPLIRYKGRTFNSHDVEDCMWSMYLDDGGDGNDLDAFGDYMRANSDDVRGLLDDLILMSD